MIETQSSDDSLVNRNEDKLIKIIYKTTQSLFFSLLWVWYIKCQSKYIIVISLKQLKYWMRYIHKVSQRDFNIMKSNIVG